MRLLPPILGALLVLLPGQSQAHIKWFCAYDTTVPPLPIADVLTPTFLAVAMMFCSLRLTANAGGGSASVLMTHWRSGVGTGASGSGAAVRFDCC